MAENAVAEDPTADHAEDDVTLATVEELFDGLTDLTEDGHASDTHAEVQETKQLLTEAHRRGLIGSSVRRLQASDVAEAFVGSVIFASPLLVEDGVFDIADYLFGFTISNIPVFLIANTLFVVLMTYALLEWTGRNKDETQLFLGIVPVRVVMILVVSFVVATILMTVWGRVGDWQPPAEAIARINVLWTVGSLGAALGDILSDSDSTPAMAVTDDRTQQQANTEGPPTDSPSNAVTQLSDSELVKAMHEQFDDLDAVLESSVDRRKLQRLREQAIQATLDDVFGDRIQKYTSRDIAEAFVGSIFFSIPFLVEDGVFDVADYFLSFQIGYVPVFFFVNAAFVLLMISALVYWAGPQDVHVSRPIFGLFPRRLVGIAVVSFITVGILMTMWGRVANWQDPIIGLARISVVWTVASFGAALGDILPGESSGGDINDELTALSDRSGDR